MKFSSYEPGLRAAAVGAVTSLMLLTGGCGEGVHNSGEDDRFIRLPGSTPLLADTSNPAPLLPTRTGNSWRNEITIRRLAGPVGGNQDPNVDDNGNPFVKAYEQSTSNATAFSSAKNSGDIRIDMRMEGQNRPNRTEIYSVNKRGVYLSRISGDFSLTVMPPLPLVSYPTHENEIKTWRGTIRIGNKSYPGVAYSRVGGVEEIELPQGKVVARRIDTTMTATVQGQANSFPMKRWFAPGVGMVRQVFISGNLEITKNLVRYKI